ncbi:geranylgeranyl pyrophosphate synthase [Clostridium sp. SY8519]|jgi:geranylgeranyl diphosphate synthase type II|uniref:polyprenyl synthetase family protein n=1 Tax=Clostridium sp. (strain SY8519) TaxID=1042156 RepID=UPI000217225B|nr:farnesyl diphosphate synthase [Clostridium sp. SY8519]BAK48391.1 geranylgeranyl pyrophosphate synthase [Clostridium sp. SY8519]
MEFKKELSRRIEEAEATIYRYLPKETGMQKMVIQAMNYSVRSGGKRLRPILMRETYRLFGGNSTVIEPFMAAIEMIHTYSLIHDDLPAMDNDELRRGHKTAHVVYGEAMAILAGDGLLNLAYETIADGILAHPECRGAAAAFANLARKAGIYGMVGGQAVDVQNDGRSIDIPTLDYINEYKTGALIEGAMMTGAILAGAEDARITEIESAAADFGLAFQIRDDILDVTGTEEQIGKPVGSDSRNQKDTYVTLRGLERASEDVQMLSERGLDVLRSLPRRNYFLEELMGHLVHRTK